MVGGEAATWWYILVLHENWCHHKINTYLLEMWHRRELGRCFSQQDLCNILNYKEYFIIIYNYIYTFYTISYSLGKTHKLHSGVYAMTSLLKITFNMQRYNTVYVCFRAGIEGIPQKTAKGGWSAAWRSFRVAFITWRAFLAGKTTRKVSVLCFLYSCNRG